MDILFAIKLFMAQIVLLASRALVRITDLKSILGVDRGACHIVKQKQK